MSAWPTAEPVRLTTTATDTVVPTILVLGCGRRQDPASYMLKQTDGGEVPRESYHWVTLDMDPTVRPDLVCKLGEDRIALPDNSVDMAIALHVLEHIGQQGQTGEWFHFWEDLYRVMKPDGRLQFECPLWSSVWAWADPTHARPISEYTFLYLVQDSYRMQGSAIPTYRVRCDWTVDGFKRVTDPVNAEVRAVEPHSMLQGILRAKKPLRPWWED